MSWSIYLIRLDDGRGYVGQTSKSLAKRLASHRNQRSHRPDMPLCVAMAEFDRDRFSIQLLQECSTQAQANAAERDWIDRLGTLVPNGFNATPGVGRRADTAAKIAATLRGRAFSPETRAKISAAAMGRRPAPSQLAAMAAGRRLWSTDPRFAQARSATNGRRRLTDDHIVQVRERLAVGESQQAIADSLGVSQTTISKLARGVTFRWTRETS